MVLPGGTPRSKIVEIVKKTSYYLYAFNGKIYHINGTLMPFTVEDIS
jgi:hypothetical protein